MTLSPRIALLSHWAKQPWLWSFFGALGVYGLVLVFARGHGAWNVLTTALAFSAFTVLVGIGQMFVITLGPGNIDLSLPATIGFASAVAMKVMDGADSRIVLGLAAAVGAGLVIGTLNYLLIWLLRIPPLIATLSSSFVIRSVGISYGRGLQIVPPPGFAYLTTARIAGISLLALVVLAFSAIAALLLKRTVYGRSMLAVGQNMRAFRSGVSAGSPTRSAAASGASAGLFWPDSRAALRSMSVRNICSPRSPWW
jgi:ribose transport system permease protein